MGKTVKKHKGVFERPKGSGVYWIRYADQHGQEHREKVGMKQAAINLYQQRKTEIRLDKFKPEDVRGKHKNANVAEIIDDYIRASQAIARKSLDDIEQRAGWWKQRLGGRAAKSIVKNDVEDARLQLSQGRFPSNGQKPKEGGRSIATINRYLSTLKAAFTLAMENEKVEKSPFRKVKLAKEENQRVRYLTDEEEIMLFSILPIEYHSLVAVALHTGLRKSEQLRLKWTDVDIKQRLITVRKSKSGRVRHIGMNSRVIEALQNQPRMFNNPYVFYGQKPGEPLQNGIKHSDWIKYLKQAGIDDFHWHDLRHTFASRLVMRGRDLYKVSKLLGHESIETTQRYAHLAPESVQREVDVLVGPAAQPAPKPAPAEDALA